MKPLESDEDDELGDYQKQLRERANRSIQQLSSVLSQRSPDEEEVDVDPSDGVRPIQSMVRPRSSTGRKAETAWSKRSDSEAVNQLRTLLLKQHKETTASPPLSPSTRCSPSKTPQWDGASMMPAIQDLVPIIYNQSEYIQHLEAEVKFCKEEIHGTKQRVRVVVVENEKLQTELKSKLNLDKTLMDMTTLDPRVNDSPAVKGQTGTTSSDRIPARTDSHTWKKELEQLKWLHQSQTETLEAQLSSLRKELAVSQRECEEAKSRLRHSEAEAGKRGGAPRVGGWCLRCAQHEAVMADTHANVHVQAIERLTKERDEVMAALRSVQASQQEAQQREWSACLQVKQAVEMSEEANLHKARVELQCEHLSRELGAQRDLLEREARGLQERLSEAREEARSEARKEKEELVQTVSTLSQSVAELEGHLNRANRETTSLTNQLDDTLRKLTNLEQDSTKLSVDLRHQLSQAQMKREEAERDLRELASKTSRQTEEAAQEVEKLSSVLVGCQHRLEAVQKDASQWQAEALSLAEQLANAQRQLHLTRQEKESATRTCGEEMEAVHVSALRRERELAVRLEQLELQQDQRVVELDGLLSSQHSLIRKLKEECSIMVARQEELTQHSRSELEQLTLEKHHLEERLEKLGARYSDMEEQCVQHGRMHQRMKNRLQLLDRHCQNSAQQVCELLSKQNQLMQERHTLTEQMQKLRVEVPSTTPDDEVLPSGRTVTTENFVTTGFFHLN